MERLTWRVNGEARIMLNGIEICGTIADRLADVEDILGDEYDLDLVQKLIQAYREGRYIILKEPEQAGVSRLRELAQADREGRCVPVVRRRECKHWEDWGACGHTDNGFDSPPMGPDDFCSKGERSTD